MNPRLSVHTVGFGNRPAAEIFRLLGAVGLRRAGVTMRQLELGGIARSIKAAREENLQVVDIAEPVAFNLQAPSTWAARQGRLRACADAAAGIGAATLYLTTGPAPSLTWADAAARFTDAIGPVAVYAAALGVRVAIENTISLRADLGFIHQLADAADLAKMAGIMVVADLYAAWSERNLDQVLTAAAEDIALVQVADFVLGTLATPDRAVPGDGDIPIARQLEWLRDAGYSGLIELELLGPRIEAEGAIAACQRGVAAIEALI